MHWESPLERDAILAAEYDPSVLSYQEQPCLVTYYDAQGTVHTYTPDLKIERASGETFAEVKPSGKLKKADLRAKLGAIALRMKERNQPFRILTEVEIRREPRFSNLVRIHEALRILHSVDRSKLEAIPQSLKGEQRFGDLVKALGSERQVFRHLQAGNLQIDLDQPISDDSLVVVL